MFNFAVPANCFCHVGQWHDEFKTTFEKLHIYSVFAVAYSDLNIDVFNLILISTKCQNDAVLTQLILLFLE